jgi:bacterioferritin
VPEALACDLRLERAAHPALKAAVAHCEKVGDYVSRELFEDILASEEEHIDFLETQIELIERVGLGNYLQSQMGQESPS